MRSSDWYLGYIEGISNHLDLPESVRIAIRTGIAEAQQEAMKRCADIAAKHPHQDCSCASQIAEKILKVNLA